ncbi:hypothetical protein LOTGIDRAFT_165489 [Lottia gigantea]|uniref:Endonuclease/exonuclease/phosphatase domain-containing protein n=1 Tax=Lottia gigantea TaxID=225164 RepID=V4A5Z1_LOTGI|nr:hypothetical protein LOTGIDRAFT_165489 [Lottia gigantea]ESO88701.1 hypothetical protein LOTGIDRAFT_165489 [Lottia gigantea]
MAEDSPFSFFLESLKIEAETIAKMQNDEDNIHITLYDIGRSHRVGPRQENRPRDIIVRFLSYRCRALVFGKKSNLKGYNRDRNFKIFVNEALTKNRAGIFKRVRDLHKEKLIDSCWTYDGRICIKTLQNKIVTIQSESDLVEFVVPLLDYSVPQTNENIVREPNPRDIRVPSQAANPVPTTMPGPSNLSFNTGPSSTSTPVPKITDFFTNGRRHVAPATSASGSIVNREASDGKRSVICGGLAVFAMYPFENSISVVQKRSWGLCVLKISSVSRSNISSDLFIIFVYIPPESSSFHSLCDFDIFLELHQTCLEFQKLGSIIVCGDLNSRTSTVSDQIFPLSDDRFISNSFFDQCDVSVNYKDRSSEDVVVNNFGRKLLDLCKSIGCVIVNGRQGSDSNVGKFTFNSSRGSSVIDYVLADPFSFECLSNFTVENASEFSDHCALSFGFNYNPETVNLKRPPESLETVFIKWDSKRSDEFRQSLTNQLIKLNELVDSYASCNDVNILVKNITSLFYDISVSCFGRKQKIRNNSRRFSSKLKHNEWYDSNCRKARSKFNRSRNRFVKTRTDYDRLIFCEHRKLFNRTKRRAKFSFGKEYGRRLSALHRSNPKEFWKSLKTQKRFTRKSSLTSTDFFNHFSALYNHQSEINNVAIENTNNICIGSLDYEISSDEVLFAIRKLKYDKSCGPDQICNEFFIESSDILLPFLRKSTVISVLSYASEVWGLLPGNSLENIQNDFVRYILRLGKGTPLAAALGEVGLFPLSILRKITSLKFWYKVVCSDNPLIFGVYKILCQDEMNGKRNWVSGIKFLFNELGLTFVFENPQLFNPSEIKRRIEDQYLQTWHSNLENSSKLRFYKNYKSSFEFESYLDANIGDKFKFLICKFRVGNLKLHIEIGRFNKTIREKRYCLCCKSKYIEDEFHFLLCCPTYNIIRRQFFHRQFWSFPSLYKMNRLMTPQTDRELLNLGKFIFQANSMRNQLLYE